MKNLRWPLLIALLALVAIVTLLLSQKTDVLQPISAPEVVPAEGGIYSEGLVGSLVRLNPVLDYYNSPDRDVDRLLYSGMLRFDDHGLPQFDLVNSWGISRDGTIYNFSLRAEAAWHDGQPVTTDDIIFTLNMMLSEDSPLPADVRDFWQQVQVTRLDEKTIQFVLPEPFAPFLDYLTFGILPAHLLEGMTYAEMVNAPFNLQPVGSGPYRFDQIITENGQITGVVLSAFTDYYGQPPYIEKIAFRYYPDAQSLLSAYQQGLVGGISQVTAASLPQVLNEPNLNVYTSRLPQLSMVFLNLDNPETPYFQDVNLRKALMMGLNRQWMIDNLLGGQAIMADGPILPGTWAYYPGIERVTYNREGAINLLRESGYTIPAGGGNVRADEDGTLLSFEMLYPDDPAYLAIAQLVQQDWQALGVDVTLTPVSYEALVVDHLETRIYQAALVDLNLSRSPDPDPYPFWHETQITGGQNYSRWNDRQASEYLEQARVTTDITERTLLYNNFQVRFSQELPALPLFYPVYTYAVDNEVQGISVGPLFDPSDRFANINFWFLVTRRATGDETPLPELSITPTP